MLKKIVLDLETHPSFVPIIIGTTADLSTNQKLMGMEALSA